ncbi:uncharacterized protein LOC127285971 [Leptopilina boulardi]|uniref:uncharacterized protein LOC127285971 n=1 Tax=Leptopilina boulardi TaxID=63433 RepID=UPI0021F5C6BA|nr:uncharacterized protein LOC127285971 [Leptopilina boulardi]XP_051168172.1 uncharacterized protein LOC127285971 [Leptopilina boulardi]
MYGSIRNTTVIDNLKLIHISWDLNFMDIVISTLEESPFEVTLKSRAFNLPNYNGPMRIHLKCMERIAEGKYMVICVKSDGRPDDKIVDNIIVNCSQYNFVWSKNVFQIGNTVKNCPSKPFELFLRELKMCKTLLLDITLSEIRNTQVIEKS